MNASEETVAAVHLTPSQQDVFDNLLAIGKPRPIMPTGLVERLRQHIDGGLAAVVWPQGRLWFSKSLYTNALRCGGLVKAEAETLRKTRLHPATVVGIATHRAIQLANTHPGAASVSWYVHEAIAHSMSEQAFSEFWSAASTGVQSDLLMQMVSRTTAFLDTFPPLDDRWNWRFEESLQTRAGSITLGAKVDLLLGRPNPRGLQTMFLADFKSSGLGEHHIEEARFYALVATLRHGIAPFRSTVVSLSSLEWTEPDVTEDTLFDTADKLVAAISSHVATVGYGQEPTLNPGGWCRFCPARDTCPQAQTDQS